MKTSKKTESEGLTRRDLLKASGLALGGLAFGGGMGGAGTGKARAECNPPAAPCYPTTSDTQTYTYFFKNLPTMDFTQAPQPPGFPQKQTPPLEPNEMRITFMGSCIPPVRRAQAMMSVFVEVGSKDGKPVDQFVFDCGSGVCANYGAMGVGFARMNKIFLAHLHGDHMSDLTHIYCFGPSGDRKSPLYVWGPGPSGLRTPEPEGRLYNDGTNTFCKHLREACRWHTESFSFETTSYEDYDYPTRRSWGLPVEPIPVSDDSPNDAYALVPIQLDWRKVGGVAYRNRDTGVKITHFPVIHARKGSIGYKLEWNGLSMIYTSDTKPEYNTIIQGRNGGRGVDVLIHEMGVPPDVWAMQNLHLSQPGSGESWDKAVKNLKTVQDSSHTWQGAFGYLLSQIIPRPRLTVATHFPVSDDTVACALASVQKHCPDITEIGSKLTWSFDLMVIRAFAGNPKPDIEQARAQVLDYGFSPLVQSPPNPANVPKYHDAEGNGDPYAQIDLSTAIFAGEDTYCGDGY